MQSLVNRLLSLIFAVCTLTAAQAEEPRIPPQYAPLYPEIYKTSTDKTGTLIGDFVHARSARDWKEAEARWSAFLARYDSKDYEDAIHARLARLAQAEQMRVLYALGKIHEADILAKRIVAAAIGEP